MLSFSIFICAWLFVGSSTDRTTKNGLDVKWLSLRVSQIISGCELSGVNATTLYTPDASHGYGAQWTRDFYYTVSGAPELMDPVKVKRAVRYTFKGQRADGCMPDRVQVDGQSVMSPGSMMPNNTRNPGHDHAWDNGPFAALLLTATVDAWPDKDLFCELEPQARRALDFVNRSSNGLVFNDVLYPNCTYGFTDGVAKTGNLLFTSLLYIDASRNMAKLAERFGCGDVAKYEAEAGVVASAIDVMKDPLGPLWLAASVDNAIPDVWGSAYLVTLNLSTPEHRQAAMDEMVSNHSKYFRYGQVRSMPYPQYWNRCCFTPGCRQKVGAAGCADHGTYQNGAFWATPMSYVAAAMIQTGHADFATQLLQECIADFQAHGIFEEVNRGFPVHTHGVLNYTASATNVLWAAKLVGRAAQGTQVSMPSLAHLSKGIVV